MTVKELIEQLQRVPQDVPVRIEGTTLFDEDVGIFYQIKDGEVKAVKLQ